MPARDVTEIAWPPGSPCWAECAFEPEHRGMHHARDFYEKLFGWRTVEADEGQGRYITCLNDERAAAGLTPELEEGEKPDWVTFFATHDVDASAEAVTRAGGLVRTGPVDDGDRGRVAYCTDPGGAHFALWQAGAHQGFGIVAEPGAVAWHTLLTRDMAVTRAFYAEVLGWTYEDRSPDLTMAALADGAQVAGLHLADHLPDNVPSHWLIHFSVVDRDSSAQIAQNLDADVLMTSESPMGPEALVRGKHGELFSLIQVSD